MCKTLFDLFKHRDMRPVNIIDAILNVIKHHQISLQDPRNTNNRLHAMGESLEKYVKDIFAGTLHASEEEKMQIHAQCFSYGGGANNPPDAMIRGGAAIEIKKVESIGSVPLNSSFPKSKLHRDDYRISNACRNAEGDTWTEKDMIYAIGHVQKNTNILKSLAFVYGDVYCADRECYENIFNTIKNAINSTPLQLEESDELAHINAVDPLGITYFRARGMWGINHPYRVFNYIYDYTRGHAFDFMAIIPTSIFDTFENTNLLVEEARTNPNLHILDKQVKNPNNTVQLINVKLITYFIQ